MTTSAVSHCHSCLSSCACRHRVVIPAGMRGKSSFVGPSWDWLSRVIKNSLKSISKKMPQFTNGQKSHLCYIGNIHDFQSFEVGPSFRSNSYLLKWKIKYKNFKNFIIYIFSNKQTNGHLTSKLAACHSAALAVPLCVCPQTHTRTTQL